MAEQEIQFTPVKDMTYSQALAELENILRTLQSDACDIDKLTVYTKRATELLRECRTRLTTTDQELRSILADLEK
jgi:exodeoxyribonuclease VII small subunit